MSNRATTWAWDVEVPSKIHRLVLLCLADHHNGLTGDCFPSLSRIVERTMCGLTAVKAALRKLGQMGLISRSERSCLRTGRTVGVVYGLAISDRDRGPQGHGGGSSGDRPGGASGDRPYRDEPESITGSEPRAGAGKADLKNAPRKERNYEPMSRSRRSSYKSGALQLLEDMEMYDEDARAEAVIRREFKGGAAQLLAKRHYERRKAFKSGAANLLNEMANEDYEVEALIKRVAKGGAAQELARRSYADWQARQPPKRNFKSGALKRLQEIYAEKARNEWAEQFQAGADGVIVDTDHWSDDDA